MKITKQIFSFLFLALFACSHKQADKKVVDTKAIQLNDSAAMLIKYDTLDYIKAISLLDKAIAIDSNYYLAYWNKFKYQYRIGRFDEALQTVCQLKRLNPNAPDIYATAGMLYEMEGDSASARKEYLKALSLYDKVLDTIMSKNQNHDILLLNKGVTLILIGQQAKGNDIVKQLYDKQTDTAYKQMFSMYLNTSRQELLDIFNKRRLF